MSEPVVSVLMPVYNAQRYVAEAVESILSQTFVDFELIIVNDGSTDGSLKILREYAERDGRIRLISRPNTGYVVALNEMLGLTRGEFLARMDADDVSLPRRFEKQVAFLRESPGVACVGGAFRLIDEEGRYLTTIHVPCDDATIQEQMLRGHNAIAHPAAMIRRGAIDRVGPYDPDLCPAEDMDLWLRMGEGGELANLPETVMSYRVHSNSVSHLHHQRQIEALREACRRACRRRGVERPFEAADGWRPTDAASRHRYVLRHGWWAFNSGERRTSVIYGAKAVAMRPMEVSGWRLLLTGLIKRGGAA